MNQAQILLAVIEAAKIGVRVEPEEALTILASFIDRLDKASVTYEKDMAELFAIGACIWQQQSLG